MARLKDGVTLDAARAQLQSIAAQLEREYPASNRSQGAVVSLLATQIIGDIQPILLLLLVGAGLLLVIALVNVVSLLLVRSEGRKRELAVRSTLGASGWRLVRQFITEAVVLVGMHNLLFWNFSSAPAQLSVELTGSAKPLRARQLSLDAVTASADENARLRPEGTLDVEQGTLHHVRLPPYGITFWELLAANR